MPDAPDQPPPAPATALPLVVAAALFAFEGPRPAPLMAQDATSHLAGWYAWEGRWDAEDSRWGVELDFQLRDFQIADDFAQFSARGGLSAAPGFLPVRITVGGAWFANGRVGPDDSVVTERRLYQTLDAAHDLAPGLRVRHRARAEQRWFEGDGLRTRYRYRVGVETPLVGDVADGVLLIVSDELLINGELTLESGARVRRLDANRSYVAVNVPLAGPTRLEVGYLNINGGFAPAHRVRVTAKTRF